MTAQKSGLGKEVSFTDDLGLLHYAGGGNSAHGGGGSGGGGTIPQPYLAVGGHGLNINLIWDSSVAKAPAGFVADVEATATYLASLFTNHVTVNVHVGYGTIDGMSMGAGALGESMTNGYIEPIANLKSQLGSDFHAASNDPTNAQGFISVTEAKAFGLAGVSSSAVDGYVGFGSNVSWNFTAPVNGVGANTQPGQYDLQGVVFHELTEVMGRISMEGSTYHGQKVYTALDLNDFSAAGTLELSKAGGYYSNDGGTSHLGNFNGSTGGGDIADWASYSGPSQSGTLPSDSPNEDPFNAFGGDGINDQLSHADVQLMDSLGFTLSDLGAMV